MAHKKWRKKTYSNGREWDGFRPVEYTLSDSVWKLPIDRLVSSPSSEGVTRTPTTVGDAFKPFNGSYGKEGEPFSEIESNSPMGWLTVKTPSGEKRFCGSPFSVELLEALLRLRKAGNNPFLASWFYYDEDHLTDDRVARYAFFVVCKGKIVEECISFTDSTDSGFDPAIFSANDELPPVWTDEYDWCEAWTSFWYRNFYTETRTGQLIVLRPDEPAVYFYPEGRWKWKSIWAFARLERRLQNITYLLFALVVVALLALTHWW
jgi:hypothetical protein